MPISERGLVKTRHNVRGDNQAVSSSHRQEMIPMHGVMDRVSVQHEPSGPARGVSHGGEFVVGSNGDWQPRRHHFARPTRLAGGWMLRQREYAPDAPSSSSYNQIDKGLSLASTDHNEAQQSPWLNRRFARGHEYRLIPRLGRH